MRVIGLETTDFPCIDVALIWILPHWIGSVIFNETYHLEEASL